MSMNGFFKAFPAATYDEMLQEPARIDKLVWDEDQSLDSTDVETAWDVLQHLLDGAGFDPDRPAFFIWLGVVPYLGRAAIADTLRYIASVPQSEVVFDYSEPLENYPPERRAAIVALGAYTAEIGEPWLSHFDPDEIAQELRGYGFEDLEDLGMSQMAIRYLEAPADTPDSGPGGHVIRAARAP